MMRTTSQTVHAIKGCLEYLLVDVEELNLGCTAYLIRLAITDLEELTDRDDAEETDVCRQIQ